MRHLHGTQYYKEETTEEARCRLQMTYNIRLRRNVGVLNRIAVECGVQRRKENAQVPFLDVEDIQIQEAVGDLGLLRRRGVAAQQANLLAVPLSAVLAAIEADDGSDDDEDATSNSDTQNDAILPNAPHFCSLRSWYQQKYSFIFSRRLLSSQWSC